jgi:hypothetical protein
MGKQELKPTQADYDGFEIRVTATTPGGRACRNVAFISPEVADEAGGES